MHVAVQGIDLGKYKLGWHDTEQSVFKPKKGLNEDIVREISWRKSDGIGTILKRPEASSFCLNRSSNI